jgi:hypothetical protein
VAGRGRCGNTALRVEPCLFCLYALIVYWFDHLPRQNRETIRVDWAGKTTITFSDAQTSVRYNAWDDYLFPHSTPDSSIEKFTTSKRQQSSNILALPA